MTKAKFNKISILIILATVLTTPIIYGIFSTAQTTSTAPITVGIIDPDYGDTVSGKIMIRALIVPSHSSWGYIISVLINGTEKSNSLPFEWDSTTVNDGWWNITVYVNDIKGNVGSDTVLVYVENNPMIEPTVRARAYLGYPQYFTLSSLWDTVWFDHLEYGFFDPNGDGFVRSYCMIPTDGFYFFLITLKIQAGAGHWFKVVVFDYDPSNPENPDTDNSAHITEGFGSIAAGNYYSLTITDVKFFTENTYITVFITSNYPFGLDGGNDETFFYIEKLAD